MDSIRQRKQHSVSEVARYCCVSSQLIKEVEAKHIHYLDFLQWISLTSYYGRIMLDIPFSVHRLEFPIAEVYFMYIRNGEPVQYAAKEARKLIIKD
jgi:hypothetical protein